MVKTPVKTPIPATPIDLNERRLQVKADVQKVISGLQYPIANMAAFINQIMNRSYTILNYRVTVLNNVIVAQSQQTRTTIPTSSVLPVSTLTPSMSFRPSSAQPQPTPVATRTPYDSYFPISSPNDLWTKLVKATKAARTQPKKFGNISVTTMPASYRFTLPSTAT
jgi:hypothetical protein